MDFLTILTGVLSVIAGFYCTFWPGKTFISPGFFVAIMIALWGISLVVKFYILKKAGQYNKKLAAFGAGGLVIAIAITVFALIAIFNDSVLNLFNSLILIAFVIWMIIMGISNLSKAAAMHKLDTSKKWLFPLIVGIAFCVIGLSAIINWFAFKAAALTVFSICIGVMLIVFGIKQIISAFDKKQ